MKKLLLTLALLLAPAAASAQCNGVFPNNTVCGNVTGAANTPRPTNPSAFLGAAGGSNGQTQYNNGGALGGYTMSGDCTVVASTGVVTCTPLGHLAGTNTWTGANYFKQGIPWVDVRAYGCVPDSSTDNTTCLQNAINAVEANYSAGIVYLSPGTGYYTLKTGGVTLHNAGVRIVGANRTTSAIAMCTDAIAISLTARSQGLQSMTVIGPNGPGSPCPTGSFAANHAVIDLSSAAINAHLTDMDISGGFYTIANGGGDVTIQDVSAGSTYGTAVAYVTGSGMWHRVSLDQNYAYTEPSAPYTINAWAPSTVYAARTIVSTGGFLIQTGAGGTSSSGAAPTLKNYAIAFAADGTITDWQLLAPTNYAAMRIDTGSVETFMDQMDMTGPYSISLVIGSSTAFVMCSQCLLSQWTNSGAYISAASSVQFNQVTSNGGLTAGAIALNIQPTFGGTLFVNGGVYAAAGSGYGASVQGAGIVSLTGGYYSGSTNGISNASSSTVISGNQIAGGAASGINSAGAIDYYNVVNNICAGRATTCITDTGAGTHKTITGNN